MNKLIFLFLIVIIAACSPQKKLIKTYVGKPVSLLESKLGKAKTVFEKDESKEYIFEKVKFLKSTEISQHKLTLDPMVSPKAKKTTLYYVTVVDDIIKKIKLEEGYERHQ